MRAGLSTGGLGEESPIKDLVSESWRASSLMSL